MAKVPGLKSYYLFLKLLLGDQPNGIKIYKYSFTHSNPDKGVIINHVSAVLINYLLFNHDNILFSLALDEWPKCVSWSSS